MQAEIIFVGVCVNTKNTNMSSDPNVLLSKMERSEQKEIAETFKNLVMEQKERWETTCSTRSRGDDSTPRGRNENVTCDNLKSIINDLVGTRDGAQAIIELIRMQPVSKQNPEDVEFREFMERHLMRGYNAIQKVKGVNGNVLRAIQVFKNTFNEKFEALIEGASSIDDFIENFQIVRKSGPVTRDRGGKMTILRGLIYTVFKVCFQYLGMFVGGVCNFTKGTVKFIFGGFNSIFYFVAIYMAYSTLQHQILSAALRNEFAGNFLNYSNSALNMTHSTASDLLEQYHENQNDLGYYLNEISNSVINAASMWKMCEPGPGQEACIRLFQEQRRNQTILSNKDRDRHRAIVTDIYNGVNNVTSQAHQNAYEMTDNELARRSAEERARMDAALVLPMTGLLAAINGHTLPSSYYLAMVVPSMTNLIPSASDVFPSIFALPPAGEAGDGEALDGATDGLAYHSIDYADPDR
tara:strand:- start:4425 stop:5825 length:1401 start_codon:yes stop_codon:yes gene_type:complete